MDAQYHIEGEGRDERGGRYFRIALPDSAITISAEKVVSEPGRLHAALTNAGINCISSESKRAVINILQSFNGDEASFRVATKIGHFHNQFVFPNRVIGMSAPQTVAVLDHLDQA